MKRWFCCMLVAAFLVFGLAACAGDRYKGTQIEEYDSASSMFIEVENAAYWRVLYHKDTKVMYVVSTGSYNNGNFTLLVNPDGSPMLYEGGNNNE